MSLQTTPFIITFLCSLLALPGNYGLWAETRTGQQQQPAIAMPALCP